MLYEVNIDFDDASIEWRKNKKSTKNGSFVYVCSYNSTKGKSCRRTVISQLKTYQYCTLIDTKSKLDKLKTKPNADKFCIKHSRFLK